MELFRLRKIIKELKEHDEEKINRVLKLINNRIKKLNNKLENSFDENNEMLRELRTDALKTHKIVSLFDSSLTRICKMKINEITEDLFIVRVYHYKILDSIIKNGFYYNGKRYDYFTSSAGQIRTKKIVCINSDLFKKYENAITCGLTKEIINEKGGVNTNKYQAYLALISSASAKWTKFNIDRIVVVDDICTDVFAEVDHIDRDTYEIERKHMNLPIEHMDGCGIMLPTVSKKTFMYRMPWMKGMLTPFDFKKFALEHKKTKIIDIYGKEYDIIEDDINIIMTKSQFKMSKYYDSWDDYKNKFKEYKCEANKLNIEDIGAEANINYQMLQTLVSMTEEELRTIANTTIEELKEIGNNKQTMLKIMGATKENKNKNYFQKALLLYPELLADPSTREALRNKKKKIVKDARSGKLRVNGHYTFIIPDLYAFCEWLFLGEKNPQGLLKNKEVYCNIFKEGEVDVLRAPHLYKEHAIRTNVLKDNISEWFITQGIYTSVHDPISKILQFDNDGDKALVVQDKTLIEVAKREMKDIVPLYYEMAKAEAAPITSENMYNALTSAYKANIGIISNDITKIWNSEAPDINAVKWLTMYNNFVIDYAKTLFLPKPPEYAEKILKSFTSNKVPHFFKYAKDKEDHLVEETNNSTVNKLEHIIEDKPIRYKKLVGELKFTNLMNNKRAVPNEGIIEKYEELLKQKRFYNNSQVNNSMYHFDRYFREEMGKIHKSESYIVDVLVRHLFEKGSRSKDNLWNVYGDILYKNLEKNLEGTIACEDCPTRFKQKTKNQCLCTKCLDINRKKQNQEKALKYYHKQKTLPS